MLDRPTTTENYHMYKLFGLPQSGSIEDHCQTMEEFNEDDIWGTVNDAEAKQMGLQENGCNVVSVCRSMGVKEGNSNSSRRSVKIPRKESCHEENNRRRMRYQSAPVNIPDWSQMMMGKKKNDNYLRTSQWIVDDENNDGRDFERIPPHELVARQLAQREITSFSVYEGIGRTLKGRDLRQVRDAVLTRTGFIE